MALKLVNEKDMRKMAQIERLIEAQVERMNLPEELGAGPEWLITAKPSNKRNKNRKPFKKKKPAQKSTE